METVKKSIIIDKKVGKEVSQLLLEGDIIVPDTKPDIDRLLKKTARAFIDSREISKDRISFKGKLNIDVLYIARGGDDNVNCMSVSAPINDFITIEGVESDMFTSTECNITNIEYKIVNDRKVSYRAIIDVTAEVISKDEEEVIIDIEDIPAGQMKKSKVNINKLVIGKNDRFIIKEEVPISAGKPNIKEILESKVMICNKDVRAGNDKITISGNLKVTNLYKSEEEENVIEFIENEIPFSGSLEAIGCEEDMLIEVKTELLESFIQAKEDDDGENRVIEVEAEIGANFQVLKEDEFETLEDAFCINQKAEMVKNSIEYPKFLCRNKNQFPIKEVVKFEGDSPAILQILTSSGNVHIDEVKAVDDKIVTEGIIEADILYVTQDDEQPLYCYSTVIPFRQSIEAKGVDNEKKLLTNLNASLEHIGVNMLSDSEVEVRCVINFDLCVREENKLSIIGDITFIPISEDELNKIASMTIYVVQKGDTLWKIAKKYNTTVEDIVAVNDIENPDRIYPNQRLLILKRVE